MLLLVWSVPLVRAADDAAQHPNVLFILTDDQRWDAAGIAGHPYLKTPGIDRLGREGVYFRNAFCTTSLCSP
ncbi:MAG: sulfatase-like hydrolase/transferase, partial [bacterium]